jgi:hypothetical protein
MPANNRQFWEENPEIPEALENWWLYFHTERWLDESQVGDVPTR